MRSDKKSKLLFFSQSWWLIVILSASLFFYFYPMKNQNLLFQELTQKYELLEKQKGEALADQEDYLLQIQSFSDPAWIEMVLKSKLGMVGEKERKIYFE